jgi:hypothetical protein
MKQLDDPALELAARAMAVVRIALDTFDAQAERSNDRHSDRCECLICFHIAEVRRLVGRVEPAPFWQRVTELQIVFERMRA